MSPRRPAAAGERRHERAAAPDLDRAWAPPRLRARLLELRPGRDPRPLAAIASVDDACQAVRRWLESLRGPAGGGAGSETSGENGDGTVTRRG